MHYGRAEGITIATQRRGRNIWLNLINMSRLAHRLVLPQRLKLRWIKLVQKYNNIVLVLEDMAMPFELDWFKKNAPERIVECGVAEANAAVIAGALAAEGFMPFVFGFTFSAIERAYNQIRQSILIDRFNVKYNGP